MATSDYEDLIQGLQTASLAHETRDPATIRLAKELLQVSRLAVEDYGSRPQRLTDSLSSIPSQASAIDILGLHAIHFLQESALGMLYCVRIDLPGVLPALDIRSRFGAGDATGRTRSLGIPALDRLVVVRTKAPDFARVFAVEKLAEGLPRFGLRITINPQRENLTVLEFDVFAGRRGKGADAIGTKVVQVAAICKGLIERQATFAEREEVRRPAVEGIEDLVQTLSGAASWLSGPVARVGDGVEGRLCLDEQPDFPSHLRVDLDHAQRATIYFRGPIQTPPERRTTFQPQDGFLDYLRGTIDTKVGAEPFDSMWLIHGDSETAKLVAHADVELGRLRERDATIEVGPEGLVVKLPAFPWDEAVLADAVAATLSLWRSVVRRLHGLNT